MTPKERAQEALLPCPFCGYHEAVNKSHASCDCCGKAYTGEIMCVKCGASVSHYDTDAEAIKAWNTRTPSPAINQESDTKEARAYAELRKSFQAVIAERDEARSALKRNQWVLSKAAACMLKPDNGITDTVWLSDGITLYDLLCCEIDGIENIVTGNVEHDIEALEKHAAAVKRGEGL